MTGRREDISGTEPPEPDRICSTCRFWSSMIGEAFAGKVEALCLNRASPNAHEYVTDNQSCEAWQHGPEGAIDQISGNPYGPAPWR